ncbi:hypothetical protein F2Q70_00037516 [Brassica cretica]|uniref:Uncharacterized protein n=1 Tax=Brassica cretica TaxID=69181 RepID=A0A8S9JZI8_BRACR|nr:hypothetical protein F2Q70_00037516 [Brassica cretica]
MPTLEVLRTTPVMASPAFKDELSLLAVLFRSTSSSSAALTWARLSASSSSSGAPERKPAVSVDVCLSHFGECLTELASSYSVDGMVTLIVKKRLGGEFNLIEELCFWFWSKLTLMGFTLKPNKLFTEEVFGAEISGMRNWKMGFLPGIRYAMKPDEAYGLVFSWDNVVI